MEPEELRQSLPTQTAQDAETAETTGTAVEQQPAEPVNGPPIPGVFSVLFVATLLSFALRKVGRANGAGNLRRWLPVVYAVVWGIAIIVVTMMYAKGLPSGWFLAMWLLFLVVAFASVGWLRSVVSGVALSVEGRISLGDSIRVGDVSGEVVAFGVRSLRVRGVDGSVHEIPNEKLVTEPVANLSGEGGDSACELTLAIPEGIDPDDAVERARSIAILTPLASPRHRPEVFLEPHSAAERRYDLRIRGYAFDAAYQDHYRSDVVSRLQAAFANWPDLRSPGEPTDPILFSK